MLRTLKYFISTALLALTFPAFADMEFIWTNANGFSSANDCRVVELNTPRYLVSKHLPDSTNAFEHVYSKGGSHYAYLLDNSLLAVKGDANGTENRLVQVIGVSPNEKVSTSKGFLEHNDSGYMKPAALKEISKFIIEIRKVPANLDKLGNDKASGTFWKAARQGDNYVTFRCAGGKEFFAFDVFKRDAQDPIARVGVSPDETLILKDIQIRSVKATEIVITEPPVTKPPVTQKTETVPLPRPRPPIAEPIQPQQPEPPQPPTVTDPKVLTELSAEVLLGSRKIPKMSHADNYYSDQGNGDKTMQCRHAWRQMRGEKVSKQRVQPALLNKMISNANDVGMSASHLKWALGTFIANQGQIPDQDYISVIDFNKRSDKKRLFIVSLRTGGVSSYLVAAGQGSDPDGDGYATVFGNETGHHESSLGCYIAAGTFEGVHGKAMLVHGFESSNDSACSRAVEFHQETYVGQVPGRSWGCFAVRPSDRGTVYSKVNNGLICAYYDGKRR